MPHIHSGIPNGQANEYPAYISPNTRALCLFTPRSWTNLDGYFGQVTHVDEGAGHVYVIVQAVESRHVRIALKVTPS